MNENPDMSNKEKDKAGKLAFNDLLKPISARIMVARILAVASALLSVGPYIVLVELSGILLHAWREDLTPDPVEVRNALTVLIWLFLAKLALYFLALTVTHFADIRLRTILQERIAQRISRAPLSWFSKTNSGLVRKAIQDDPADIHTVVAHAPVDNTIAILSPVALLGYAFYLNWLLGLIAIATIPFYLGAMAYMVRDMGEKTAEMDTRLGYVSATMVEFITGIAVVKAFGKTGQAHERYRCATEEFHKFYLAWCGPMLRMSAIANATISPSILLLTNLGLGTLAVHYGYAQPTDVIPTAIIALMIPQSIEVLANMTWSIQMAGAASLRIQKILNIAQISQATQDHAHTIDVSVPQPVVFDHVSFSYGDTQAVDDVSLTLQPGSVTALIGPSGGGKSTLATLLARFSDPDGGTISIGGTDIRTLPDDQLYRCVSFVLQDPQILRMSIRENVGLGNPHASDEAIWQALRDAQIADEIAALPRSLDTIYGVDTHLSGGQCQRLSIARALLIDAPILILDEATAFTDPESEALIQTALTSLIKSRNGQRTVLVIAHRPASVHGVDQIAILENGKLSAIGSPSEVSDHPLYVALWEGTNA
ncbi:ABC transporter ATP-binding protein [Arcanobacterium pinnipediorum]|uniref:ABC transporter ATP-binding protein/permease n=1 Tax=Arcanobacterium pinnipediorum TaxID=1503041 RepID=A0ABY5AGD7_9ACTO|nr:ABC transporter ATP-binding protein [Arcanobacterium pinnipediorum]USR78927.1 ABC transporter ATP-binding protein/permease [Arcanobacterium pinnipediorum]